MHSYNPAALASTRHVKLGQIDKSDANWKVLDMWQRLIMVCSLLVTWQSVWGQSEVVPVPKSAANVSQLSAAAEVYHTGWGFANEAGELTGKVLCIGARGQTIPQGNATVTLSQNLQVLASGQTASDGSFSFSGVEEGVYEIATESVDCYAMFSFQVMRAVANRTPPPMLVFASSLSHARVDEVLETLWTPVDSADASNQPFESVLGPRLSAVQTQRVSLFNGRVNGQVAFANPLNVPEIHVVKVFRGGTQIASAPVDRQGRFSFIASPGPIDVVLGGSAYAVLGAELVDSTQLSALTNSSPRFVSTAMQAAPPAQTLLVPAVGGPGVDALPPPPALGAPMGVPMTPMAGGFGPWGGGTRGGFGGGGYGGGGWGAGNLAGALLGAAGLAVGIAALEDDDENGFVAPPASPVSVR